MLPVATVLRVETVRVYTTRWGFVPCSYEVYLLLKELHGRYQKALRQFRAWQRWHRKAPHNRVVRERLRDAQGRRCGCRIVGPRPEPGCCPVFTRWQTLRPNAFCGNPAERTVFSFAHEEEMGWQIIAAYRQARTPRATSAEVRPLEMPESEIRELVEKLRAGT